MARSLFATAAPLRSQLLPPDASLEQEQLTQQCAKHWTPAAIATLVLAAIVAGIYLYLLLDQIDFVGRDYSHFTYFSLRDKFYPLAGASAQGRFFPFGHQAFNFISFLSKTRWGYSLFSVFQMSAAIAAIFIVLHQTSLYQRVLTALSLVVLPSFVVAFFEIIIPERNIIFGLTIFIVSVQALTASRSRLAFFAERSLPRK